MSFCLSVHSWCSCSNLLSSLFVSSYLMFLKQPVEFPVCQFIPDVPTAAGWVPCLSVHTWCSWSSLSSLSVHTWCSWSSMTSLSVHTWCTAPAATNYPSLRNSLNGWQGHPPFCLSPPDRPRVTRLDSNDVRTRSIYSTISIDDINAQNGWSLKTEKIRINNMYALILFTQYGIYFWHELAYTLHYIS